MKKQGFAVQTNFCRRKNRVLNSFTLCGAIIFAAVSRHLQLRDLILAGIDLFYPPFRRFLPLQTFRYAACGGINTGLDIGLFFVLHNYVFQKQVQYVAGFAVSAHIAAFFAAFVVTFPIGFFLSRYVVWQQTTTKKRVQLFRYLMIVLLCIVLNYLFLKLFVDVMGWWPTVSKLVTTIFVVAFSYLAQRNYSFKEPK